MSQVTEVERATHSSPTVAPLFGAVLAGMVAIASVVWSLPRGLDGTDEGYYLNEIAHPSDSSATALLFGWFWHPLYAVVGESVVGLRFIGMALVTAATVALTLGLLSLVWTRDVPGQEAPSRPHRSVPAAVGLCLVAVGLALIPLSVLPLTPSYNTLALLALLCTAVGCRYAWVGERVLLGGAVIGLGGFLAVVAKPTTALVLGIVVLLLTPWSRRLLPGVAAAAGVLVLLGAILVAAFPGHLPALVTVVERGVEATVGHPHLVRFDRFRVDRVMLLSALAAGALGALAGLVAAPSGAARSGRKQLTKQAVATVLGLAAALPAVVALARAWRDGTTRNFDLFQPQATLYVFGLTLALAALTSLAALVRRSADRPSSVELRLAALLACLPLAYAFGTNTNLWRFSGHVVVFWFLAVLILTRGSGWLATSASGVATYAVLVAGVSTPLAPYRSAPILDTAPTQVSRGGQTIALPPAQARLTAGVLEVGRGLKVSRETTVLDLTGESPGTIWAWGARPMAQGWVIGGYADSATSARVAINPVACRLRTALVLRATEGSRRALPDDVLAQWGVRVPDDYRVAAEYLVPEDPLVPTGSLRAVQVLVPVTARPTGCGA
ncbi:MULTISPECIES: hypothetical protein [unclassified Knoellia]|uniref:hypothetical protein n=1 Tax=Knoellia altitudinis TaxID=3404795 RepID=UPI003606E03B